MFHFFSRSTKIVCQKLLHFPPIYHLESWPLSSRAYVSKFHFLQFNLRKMRNNAYRNNISNTFIWISSLLTPNFDWLIIFDSLQSCNTIQLKRNRIDSFNLLSLTMPIVPYPYVYEMKTFDRIHQQLLVPNHNLSARASKMMLCMVLKLRAKVSHSLSGIPRSYATIVTCS